MPYLSFLYSYSLTLFTAVVIAGYCALYIRHKKSVHLFTAILFSLYLVDITILWMSEMIPGFSHLLISQFDLGVYVYFLLSALIVLSYRLIFGELLRQPLTSLELSVWAFCLASTFVEWYVRSFIPVSTASPMVFELLLSLLLLARIFIAYRERSDELDALPRRSALFFLAAFSCASAADALLPNASLRSIPFELLGLGFTLIAVSVLWKHALTNRERAEAFHPIRIAKQYGLTRREEELYALLVRGMSNREIGAQLCISPGTVKSHVRRIYEKMNVASRSELIERYEVDRAASSLPLPLPAVRRHGGHL